MAHLTWFYFALKELFEDLLTDYNFEPLFKYLIAEIHNQVKAGIGAKSIFFLLPPNKAYNFDPYLFDNHKIHTTFALEFLAGLTLFFPPDVRKKLSFTTFDFPSPGSKSPFKLGICGPLPLYFQQELKDNYVIIDIAALLRNKFEQEFYTQSAAYENNIKELFGELDVLNLYGNEDNTLENHKILDRWINIDFFPHYLKGVEDFTELYSYFKYKQGNILQLDLQIQLQKLDLLFANTPEEYKLSLNEFLASEINRKIDERSEFYYLLWFWIIYNEGKVPRQAKSLKGIFPKVDLLDSNLPLEKINDLINIKNINVKYILIFLIFSLPDYKTQNFQSFLDGEYNKDPFYGRRMVLLIQILIKLCKECFRLENEGMDYILLDKQVKEVFTDIKSCLNQFLTADILLKYDLPNLERNSIEYRKLDKLSWIFNIIGSNGKPFYHSKDSQKVLLTTKLLLAPNLKENDWEQLLSKFEVDSENIDRFTSEIIPQDRDFQSKNEPNINERNCLRLDILVILSSITWNIKVDSKGSVKKLIQKSRTFHKKRKNFDDTSVRKIGNALDELLIRVESLSKLNDKNSAYSAISWFYTYISKTYKLPANTRVDWYSFLKSLANPLIEKTTEDFSKQILISFINNIVNKKDKIICKSVIDSAKDKNKMATVINFEHAVNQIVECLLDEYRKKKENIAQRNIESLTISNPPMSTSTNKKEIAVHRKNFDQKA